jgi:prepilin-type N-terminal cleavage/methylation domain-containing protein
MMSPFRRVGRPRSRRGFSLIEVMVAMTLLAIILTVLAKFATIIAVRGRGNDLTTKRTSALQLEANKLGAAPFSTLATWSTANRTITQGDFTYTRRLTITSQSATRYSIKIIVVPSSDATRPDSILLDRTQPGGSPLCVGC